MGFLSNQVKILLVLDHIPLPQNRLLLERSTGLQVFLETNTMGTPHINLALLVLDLFLTLMMKYKIS